MVSFAARCLALLVASTVLGCHFPRTQPGIQVSSRPSGARVHIDGNFTGQVTPAHLGLPLDATYSLTIEKDGYEPQMRVLTPNGQWTFVDWRRGWFLPESFWFPLFLPWPEAFVPIRYEERLAPQRLHFQLRRKER